MAGVGQQRGAAAREAAGRQLPAQPGPWGSATGKALQGARQQVPVEAHVDPGVAAAAEVAQEHGDGEGHIGGIC